MAAGVYMMVIIRHFGAERKRTRRQIREEFDRHRPVQLRIEAAIDVTHSGAAKRRHSFTASR